MKITFRTLFTFDTSKNTEYLCIYISLSHHLTTKNYKEDLVNSSYQVSANENTVGPIFKHATDALSGQRLTYMTCTEMKVEISARNLRS